MIKSYKLVLFIAGISLFAILAGCVLPNYKEMTVEPTSVKEINPKLKNAIVVDSVFCAKNLYALQVPIVDDMLNDMMLSKEFKKALEGSLNEYGYLANSTDEAKYNIGVIFKKLESPLFQINVNMKSTVGYKISGPNTDKKYTITAGGKATLSDAFFGDGRTRIATERSIKENIKEFLKHLSSF